MKSLVDSLEHACSESGERRDTFLSLKQEMEAVRRGIPLVVKPVTTTISDDEHPVALEEDLDAASLQAADSEERLKKLEEQVQALSDAVIVIAEPSPAVDEAVKIVKDKM